MSGSRSAPPPRPSQAQGCKSHRHTRAHRDDLSHVCRAYFSFFSRSYIFIDQHAFVYLCTSPFLSSLPPTPHPHPVRPQMRPDEWKKKDIWQQHHRRAFILDLRRSSPFRFIGMMIIGIVKFSSIPAAHTFAGCIIFFSYFFFFSSFFF